MVSRDELLQLIYDAFDAVNEMYDDDNKLQVTKSEDSTLYDADSALDSLSLINLVVGIEERVADKYDVEITLVNETALSSDVNPFHRFGTLADHLYSLMRSERA